MRFIHGFCLKVQAVTAFISYNFLALNITVRQNRLSGGDRATVPAVQSQQF